MSIFLANNVMCGHLLHMVNRFLWGTFSYSNSILKNLVCRQISMLLFQPQFSVAYINMYLRGLIKSMSPDRWLRDLD